MPARSSLGSGSVYPAAFASATMALKGLEPSKELKMKLRVPLCEGDREDDKWNQMKESDGRASVHLAATASATMATML